MPRALARSAEPVAADTLSERAAALIQRDILTGRFAPGSRLGIMDLASDYGMGATPVREGLSRLVARQTVVAPGQRGFRVAAAPENHLPHHPSLRVLAGPGALSPSRKFRFSTMVLPPSTIVVFSNVIIAGFEATAAARKF